MAGPLPNEFSCRCTDEGHVVPVVFGKPPGGVEGVPRSGRIAVVGVDLANIRRTRKEERVVICSRSPWLTEPGLFVVPSGKGEIKAWICVRGRAVNVKFLRETQTPCVVGSVLQKFHRTRIRLESKDSGAEPMSFSTYLSSESRIPRRGPDPVVHPVSEVGGSGVGVTCADTGEKDFAQISHVISVGILEEKNI